MLWYMTASLNILKQVSGQMSIQMYIWLQENKG